MKAVPPAVNIWGHNEALSAQFRMKMIASTLWALVLSIEQLMFPAVIKF